jgi:hypothetical protein
MLETPAAQGSPLYSDKTPSSHTRAHLCSLHRTWVVGL